MAGRVAGGIENKANSVQFQFQFQLSVGTELGNIIVDAFTAFIVCSFTLTYLGVRILYHIYHKES